MSETVMCRDASFWVNPDTTKPKKYHAVGPYFGKHGHPLAKCDRRINLLAESAIDQNKVSASLCARCFPKQDNPSLI